jgi:hypothetical protein
VQFSNGWLLTADAWDAQMLFLGQPGHLYCTAVIGVD